MNRRAFLSLSAALPVSHLSAVYGCQPAGGAELRADVVVVGGVVGGVACALAAARGGRKVILTEEYDWIGGQLTSQGVPPDEHAWIEERGSSKTYRALRTGVREFYRRNYPLTPVARKNVLFNPGNGSVSKLCHEPRVALAVLLEMLAPHVAAGRVRLMQPYVPVEATTDGDAVASVTVGRMGSRERVVLLAPYFVDATETGELLPLTGTEYVTGSEARQDTKEPHASVVARPHNHQAFTFCFAMDYQEGKDNRIEEPPGYKKWLDYTPDLDPRWPGPLLSWDMSDPKTLKPRALGFDPTGPVAKGLNLWTYRRILDRDNFSRSFFTRDAFESDVCLVNWPQNDYWLGNLYDADRDEIDTSYRLGRELSLSLLYWLQTEAPRLGRKRGWPGLRLRGDVMGTEDGLGLAMAPYVRESRRIQAVFTVTENHVGVDARAKVLKKKPGEFAAEAFADSVGTGSYRIDLHPSSGGDNYIDVSSLPFQIPLGALIPKRVENLLPACKNIGTTHITNGCYRLHPVEWVIGEAVGELVAFCLARDRVPRQVRKDPNLLADFQARLTRAGVDLDWPADIAKSPR